MAQRTPRRNVRVGYPTAAADEAIAKVLCGPYALCASRQRKSFSMTNTILLTPRRSIDAP